MSSALDAEPCENCGRTIGKLETPSLFNEHVVCAECYRRLTAARSAIGASPELAGGQPHAVPDPVSLAQLASRVAETKQATKAIGDATNAVLLRLVVIFGMLVAAYLLFRAVHQMIHGGE